MYYNKYMSKCWRNLINTDLNNFDIINILQEDKILKEFTKCIGCYSNNIKFSRTNMIRCKKCHLEWSIRKGSILDKSKISLKQAALLFSLYKDGLSSYKASQIARVNKNTAHKFFKIFKTNWVN